jgi:hypothetical protein
VSARRPIVLKKDELSNPNSCLNRAASDEPIFVLRANDPVAPSIVRDWASRYLEAKMNVQQGVTTDNQLKKYHEAFDSAKQMVEWQVTHYRDVAPNKETL